jgi:PAS domain S-box-containing protein
VRRAPAGERRKGGSPWARDNRLFAALTVARAGLWEYDLAADAFTFNDAFYAIFHTAAGKVGGYTRSSSDYARRFCHPDDAGIVAREIAAAPDTKDPRRQRRFEHRIVYDDGEIGTLLVHVFVIRDDGGRTVGTYGVKQDVTEYGRAEEQRARSEAMFRSLFMSMSEGFYLAGVICDEHGKPCDYRYLEANEKFAEILGLPRDRIIGRRYREIVPVDTTQLLENFFSVARTGKPTTYLFYSAEYDMHFETYSYRPAQGSSRCSS